MVITAVQGERQRPDRQLSEILAKPGDDRALWPVLAAGDLDGSTGTADLRALDVGAATTSA